MLESVFDEVADIQVWNFIRKRLRHRHFRVKFAKFLRTFILKNSCKRLLLFLLTEKKVTGGNIWKHRWYWWGFKIKKAIVDNKVRAIEQRFVLDLSSKTSSQATSLQNCFSNDLSVSTWKTKRMYTNVQIWQFCHFLKAFDVRTVVASNEFVFF